MIESTIYDYICGRIEDKVKIEDCMQYDKFCECKEQFLSELDADKQKTFKDIMYYFECLHDELNYQKNILALNYGIKIGMELQEFFETLKG